MTVCSGVDCMSLLNDASQWGNAIRPDLIFLDLNMPGSGGRELLPMIKNDPNLCHIPVIVFSNSSLENDVLDSYQLYANSFISKPVDYQDLLSLIRHVLHYWFNVTQITGSC